MFIERIHRTKQDVYKLEGFSKFERQFFIFIFALK